MRRAGWLSMTVAVAVAGCGWMAGWVALVLQEATTDAFKTLFVARLAYDVDERKLKREMEHYGACSRPTARCTDSLRCRLGVPRLCSLTTVVFPCVQALSRSSAS